VEGSFFTVNLLDRRLDRLVTQIDVSREALRQARVRAPSILADRRLRFLFGQHYIL
jgi:hypothetical protein